jgi:OmpA-OmpF porin, OOP family
MSKSNALWWGLLITWMGLSVFWHVCEIKGLCSEFLGKEETAVITPTLPPLRIRDGNRFEVIAQGNIAFGKSGATPDLSAVHEALDSLAYYLRMHPMQRLTILGAFSSEETNSSSYPDLGIARAESIKKYLLMREVADSLLSVRSQLLDTMSFSEDTLWGGIEFSIYTVLPTTEAGLAHAQVYENVHRPMHLYFYPGSTDFIRTPYNERFIEEARLFLSENKEKTITLIGYTDSNGEDSLNLAVSGQQAEMVKKQLLKLGFDAAQIRQEGKGKADPIESNDTPEGQQANRRVTLIVPR